MGRRATFCALISIVIAMMFDTSPAHACSPTAIPTGKAIDAFAYRVSSAGSIFEAAVVGQFLIYPDADNVAVVVQATRYFKGAGPGKLAIKGWGQPSSCRSAPPRVGEHQIFFTFNASQGGIVDASYDGGGPILPANEQSASKIIAVTNRQPSVPTDAGSAQAGRLFGLTSVVFSPDGRTILSSGWDAAPRLWDAKTGQLLLTLQGHTAIVQSVVFSPDGQFILTGSDDQTARLWDAKSGQLLLTLEHHGLVSIVAVSPDGRTILTGSWDQVARLWDAKSGQLLIIFNYGREVWGVAFSPDGQRVLRG